jgi:hypothetical protein
MTNLVPQFKCVNALTMTMLGWKTQKQENKNMATIQGSILTA